MMRANPRRATLEPWPSSTTRAYEIPTPDKPWALLTGDGKRVQVRAEVASATGEGPSRHLRAFKSWDFDLLLVILFNSTYQVQRATEIPAAVAEGAASFAPKSNGYVLVATDDILDELGADLTEAFRELQEST